MILYLVTFIAGVIVGSSKDHAQKLYQTYMNKKKKKRPPQARRGSVVAMDAYQKLEARGKIDVQLSPSENAIRILENLATDDADDLVRSSLLYAANVLRSDFGSATVPVGLNMNNDDQRSKNRGRRFSMSQPAVQTAVLDWLVSNYTPEVVKNTERVHKLKLRSVAQGVKMAVKFRRVIGRSSSDSDFEFLDAEIRDQVKSVLQGVDDWNWDVWTLREASRGKPLQSLGWYLLCKWDLISALKLDRTAIIRWLEFVEKQYPDNHYHSSTHATDVLQAVHFFLEKCGVAEFLSKLAVFALLISAMIHDMGHDGFNNLYHQHAHTERALLFNDQSIQENFHCMSAFTSMSRDRGIDILATLEPEQANEVRRLMILMTLATDMKGHFKHLHEFKSMVASLGDSREAWQADTAALDQLCAHVLHASDLSNPCRGFDLAHKWAKQVMQEFFAQGDREKAEGLPISPLCSRDGTLLPASQIGFINFVVLPYYQVLAELLPGLRGVVAQVEANLQRWKELENEEVMRAATSSAAAASAAAAAAAAPASSEAGKRGSTSTAGGGGGKGIAARASAALKNGTSSPARRGGGDGR